MRPLRELRAPESSTLRRGAEAVWLVVDPSSGENDAPDQAEALGERLRDAYGGVRVVPTAGPGDAAAAARAAGEAGARLLFVAGGDGTVNEVVDGLSAGDAPARRPAVGIIPLGAGNDFARALGVDGPPLEALETLLEAEPYDVDVGRVNGRVFLNASAGGLAGGGPDAATPELATFAGRFAYVLGGVRAYVDHEGFDVRYRSSAGGRTLRGRERISMFAVCNAPAFGGSNRVVAPGARPDDGLLEVCLVREAPAFESAALLAKLAEGRYVNDPHVLWLRASRLELFFERATKISADGETFEARSASYSVMPRALRVLAPRGVRTPASFDEFAKSA